MVDDLSALARAVVRLVEGDAKALILPPGYRDMVAAYVALFQRQPETIAPARRLLERPGHLTTVELDERGDPIVSPEEAEYFRLSGALMAAVRERTDPGNRVEVQTVPGPPWLGRAAVRFMRLSWAARSAADALIHPVAHRAVMIRQRRRR